MVCVRATPRLGILGPALTGATLVATAMSWSAGASAREPHAEGELSFDVRDYWLHKMPTFELSDPTKTSARTVGTGTLPSSGDQHFLAAGFDTAVVVDQRVQIPLFGIYGAGAIGQSPRVITSLDGTFVTEKPWTAGAVTFLLPGLGFRFKERRWMFAANVRASATFVWMSVTYQNGASQDDSQPAVSAGTFGARGHLEVCRRLDPETRACLFVEPHLYEFGFMNGGSAGLRWEIGQ
jgi:hypothetical protein